jgi:hypothetical protein
MLADPVMTFRLPVRIRHFFALRGSSAAFT